MNTDVSEPGAQVQAEGVSPATRARDLSTERVRRWRKRNPARDRSQSREAGAKYRGTAKGMLAQLRWQSAKKRG